MSGLTNMNYIKDINLNNYNIIIEIPVGTDNKWELEDKSFDKLVLVRKVVGKYPFYYGCFPQTLAGDNDPLDMILLSNKKRYMLDIVDVIPIGVIKTIDNGEVDDKIFVIAKDETIKNLEKLKARAIKFLHSYKGKKSNMIIDKTFYGPEVAIELIEQAHKNFYPKKNDNLKIYL